MGGQAQVLISRQTRELTSEIEQLPVYHTSPAGERLNLLIKTHCNGFQDNYNSFPLYQHVRFKEIIFLLSQ